MRFFFSLETRGENNITCLKGNPTMLVEKSLKISMKNTLTLFASIYVIQELQ